MAVRAAAGKAFVIPDGTLLPIERIAADRPYYSGKHKKHEDERAGHRPSVRTSAVGHGGPGRQGVLEPAVPCGFPTAGRWEKLSAGQQAVNHPTPRSARSANRP
jgi:hypothetical protein